MPVVVLVVMPMIFMILFIWCIKYFNLNIIPENLRLPPPTKKFVFPNLRRNKNYEWEINKT